MLLPPPTQKGHSLCPARWDEDVHTVAKRIAIPLHDVAGMNANADVDLLCVVFLLVVCAELRVHTTLEEEIVYPALREAIEDEDIMNEAAVEHETAKMLIEQLENMEPDDPNYFATFTVLGEYVMHHVKEEEGEMFPQAKKAKDLDLEALGEQIKARKEELSAETEQA